MNQDGHDFAHIHIGGLFNREHKGAGNRIRGDRHLVHCAKDLDLRRSILHGSLPTYIELNESRVTLLF
jgi:hypothetical protein